MAELSQHGVVTKAGISAAIDAGTSGPEIKITGFRIGSLSAAEGSIATEDDTDVDGFVYEGTIDQMRYSRIDDDTVVWRLSLGQTVGDFDVGNIGLMLESGVMFAKAVMPGQSSKYKSNPPTIIGNRKFYNIVLVLSNVSNLLDINIHESLEASLPEVPTELDLPDPNTTPYNAYLVLNHTKLGEPTVAVRRTGAWFHRSYYTYPNQGIGVLACVPSMYDSGATVGSAVKFNSTSKKFVLADGADANLQADGIRTSSYEMTTTGMVGADAVGLTTPLTPGTVYYAGTGANIGKLVTTANGEAVAIAVNTTDIWINLGNLNLSTAGGTSDPTIYITIDPDSVDPTLPPGSVVYLNGPLRIWQAADSLDPAKRPVGMLNEDKTRIVLLGRVDITASTAAWPKPLTAGALYYVGSGADVGKLLSSSASRYIAGTAHGPNSMIVRFEALATNTEHLSANAAAVTAKSATPSGVKAALDEHAASRNHPGATISNVGFGRPATDSEVLAGAAAPAPAYQFPWVTPTQLKNYPFPNVDTSLFVLKSGSTMNSGADLTFVGSGDPTKAGSPYWHPSNDGPGSGLDADLLDGIQGAQFVRNDRDSEPVANDAVYLKRETANANRGVVDIRGRTGQSAGGALAFTSSTGAPGIQVLSSNDRRTLHGQMYSDAGITFEDQFRFSDDGDLWLRKMGKKISELGLWTVVEGTVTSVTTWSFDVTPYSIIIWSFDNHHNLILGNNTLGGIGLTSFPNSSFPLLLSAGTTIRLTNTTTSRWMFEEKLSYDPDQSGNDMFLKAYTVRDGTHFVVRKHPNVSGTIGFNYRFACLPKVAF